MILTTRPSIQTALTRKYDEKSRLFRLQSILDWDVLSFDGELLKILETVAGNFLL